MAGFGPTALFWETPAVTAATADSTAFALALTPAPMLATVRADPDTFRAHFTAEDCGSKRSVAVFKNLGGDSELIAPCPLPSSATSAASLEHNAHLMAFLQGAPPAQIMSLFGAVADVLARSLATRAGTPVWMSTSGAGVYWLHVRLDSRPKYYQYAPFAARP